MKQTFWGPVTATLVLAMAVAADAPPLPCQSASPDRPAPYKTLKALEPAISRVDQLFAQEYARHSQASITIGVISGPDLVWTKSYGLADIEHNVPATKDSTYRIGSITKQFTTVMLLQLVEQGKVRLSDPVEKYYPEVRQIPKAYPAAPPITLLQLVTHTAGLNMEPDDTATYTAGKVSDWEKTLRSALPHTRYAFEPGTRYAHSNIGLAILGAALGRAAGEPYIQYVQKHILEPLGMTHSAFEQNDDILRTLAKGYDVRGATPDPGPAARELQQGRGYKVPNGAIFTTVGDMARFVSFEMGYGPASVLKRETLTDIFSRVNSANGDLTFGFGVGFMMLRRGDLVAIGHDGAVEGYVARVYFNPRSQVGTAYFQNAGRTGREETRSDIIMDALDMLSR